MCFNLNLLNQCLSGISKEENQEAEKRSDHEIKSSKGSESLLDQQQQQQDKCCRRRSTNNSLKNSSILNSSKQQQDYPATKLELFSQVSGGEAAKLVTDDEHHRRIGDKLSNYNRGGDRRRSSAQNSSNKATSLFINPITSSLSSFSSLEPSVLSNSSVDSVMENNKPAQSPTPLIPIVSHQHQQQMSRQQQFQQSPQHLAPTSPSSNSHQFANSTTIPFQLSAQSQPLPPPNSLPFHQSPASNQFPMLNQQQQLSPRALMSLNNTNSSLNSLNRQFIKLEKSPVAVGGGGGVSVTPFELNMKNLNMKKHAYTFDADQLLPTKPTPNDQELSSLLDENLNNMRLDDSMFNNPTGGGSMSSSNASINSTGKFIYEKKSSSSSSHPTRQHHHHHQQQQMQHHEKHKPRGGKIHISASLQVYDFVESDFQNLGQIGHGEFGTVDKVLHKPSQTYMAMKRLLPTVGNQRERKKALKELDFVLECHEYEFVVKFYGVKFNNEPADCLICMELMDTSLEKFYKFVYDVKSEEIPEPILGRIVYATVNALNYLKEKHQIIHRDVKPSNILVDRHGAIKMCDFGISGRLVDSIAASRDAGCQLYMAPERIDPAKACGQGYDVRSDVWSLGISLYELSTGKFPYPQWKSIFHQLDLVVGSDAPRLESERLSHEFKDFVNTCLTKDDKKRPKYKQLLEHRIIQIHQNSGINVADYFGPYINEMQQQQQAK